jgi:5-formyltetrahydrofolate cyclo-ligase
MPDISEQKQHFRSHYLEIRKNLSTDFVTENSKVIMEQVLNSEEFKQADLVHCYVSMPQNNEVSTHHFIRDCFKKNKSIAVPKIGKGGELKHLSLASFDDLRKNRWGVLEPNTGKERTPGSFSLIIVPVVAGDPFRNRIGYGKGYYDRFLAKSDAVKMGVLFDCQLHKTRLPSEPFDIPLDILITEKERIG